MKEQVQASNSDALEPVRKMLTEKSQRITALEAALPTLGSGLVAEAVVYYLLALNADYFAACEALANVASKPQEQAAEQSEAEAA